MTPDLPLCSSNRAFQLLARQLPEIDSPDALLRGAVAIAMHEMENVDPEAVDATIQRLADTVRIRVRGTQQQAMLAHLHELLFDEMGFRGNAEDYQNPANSYLPAVLESRRGLPIILSLVYRLVAERLGISVWGVGLPGHFLVGVDSDDSPMLIDAFAGGRELSIEEAHERLKQTFGNEIRWSPEFLQPASNRHWLTRILQNLLNVFGGADRYSDVAAMLEMEMLLWPEQNHLQRDLGLVLARCGMSEPASLWLGRYVESNPDDPQMSELKELLGVLSH